MKHAILLALAGVSLAACTVPPPAGPTLMALPPQGKDFGLFQREDQTCQQSAGASIGYGAEGQAATNQAVGSAVAGTALGAAAGALIGAASGNAGAGAAIGAGAGLITGSAVGAGQVQGGQYAMQAQFDTVYAQCMTAYGNTVQAAPVAPPTVPYYATPYYPYPVYPYPYYYGPRVGFYGGWGYGGGWGYRGGWRGRRW